MDLRASNDAEIAKAPAYGVTVIRGMKLRVPRILILPSVINTPIYVLIPSIFSRHRSIDAALIEIDHLRPSESSISDWSMTIFLLQVMSMAPCGMYRHSSGVRYPVISSGGIMQKWFETSLIFLDFLGQVGAHILLEITVFNRNCICEIYEENK